jgi:hypothetical protein
MSNYNRIVNEHDAKIDTFQELTPYITGALELLPIPGAGVLGGIVEGASFLSSFLKHKQRRSVQPSKFVNDHQPHRMGGYKFQRY